jgi:hypothetical protein
MARKVLLQLLIAASGIGVTAEAHTWFAAESGIVRVLSDVSPAAATRALREVESADAIFRSLVGLTMTLPIRAFAVKDSDSLRELAPQFWERGGIRPHAVAYTAPHNAFLAVREDLSPAARREALFHEYVHLLTAAQAPDAPAWLDEGLSEFWGNVVVEGDRVIVGRPVKRHVARLGRWHSLDRALRLPRGVFIADSEPASLFYAQSWAMVHYLLVGRRGAEALTLVPAYKPLPDDFESSVRRYVSSGEFREVVLPVTLLPPPSSIASYIPEARALAERAQMLVFGARPDAAVRMAKRSLALQPRDALALEVMGTYYFLQNKHDEARPWLTRAFDTTKASPAVALYLALLATSTADRERFLTAAVGAQPAMEVAWRRLWDLYRADGRLDQLRLLCHLTTRPPLSLLKLAAVPVCA